MLLANNDRGKYQMKATTNNQTVPQLIGLVRAIRDCCQRNEYEMCQQLALTASQFACLLAMPETSALNVHQLGEALKLSPSRASRIVDSLVREGLLDRRTTAKDRRQQHLTLTAPGRAKWHKAHTLLMECEKKLLSQLPAQRSRDLEAALKTLINALTEGGRVKKVAKNSALAV
jgi:MarR family transcriptional regulator, organic hydroperoxide resistance regulator